MSQMARELLFKQLQERESSALDLLLEGEISAVEAYNHAMQRVKDTQLISALQECRNSHASRVQRLQERLSDLGLAHKVSAGIWGNLAVLMEDGASLLSDQFALGVLLLGEDYGVQQYKTLMQFLDSKSWEIADMELAPAQAITRRALSLICQSAHDRRHGH